MSDHSFIRLMNYRAANNLDEMVEDI